MSKKRAKKSFSYPTIEQVSARAHALGMSYGQYSVSTQYVHDCGDGIFEKKGAYSRKAVEEMSGLRCKK